MYEFLLFRRKETFDNEKKKKKTSSLIDPFYAIVFHVLLTLHRVSGKRFERLNEQ